MRFEELAYTVDGLPVTVGFHARLTVMSVPAGDGGRNGSPGCSASWKASDRATAQGSSTSTGPGGRSGWSGTSRVLPR